MTARDSPPTTSSSASSCASIPRSACRAIRAAACTASSAPQDVDRRQGDQDVSGIKVVDPDTVTFTTNTPNALLPYNLSELSIVQKASVSADPASIEIGKSQYWNTPNDASGKGGVQGTGPFIVSAYSAGQSMEVRRNDNYWRGKPFLDKIIRREFKDTATALLAFDAGQVDVTYVTADDVERENTEHDRHRPAGPVGRRPRHRPQPDDAQGLRQTRGSARRSSRPSTGSRS